MKIFLWNLIYDDWLVIGDYYYEFSLSLEHKVYEWKYIGTESLSHPHVRTLVRVVDELLIDFFFMTIVIIIAELALHK